MIYLTDDEIPIYCDSVRGVTVGMVRVASALIDAFLGKDFMSQQYSESVSINKRHRAKLKHSPIISIDQVKVLTYSPFGAMTQEVPLTNCYIDPENDGYFTYIASPLALQIFGINPNQIQVTYTAGHTKVPENLKTACGMLAQNIKSKGTFVGEKELSTLDYRVMMTDDSLFTSDIRLILVKYKGGV